jgi:hypothetical protein
MEQLETSDTGTTKTIIAYHVSKKLDALSLRYIRLHVRVIPLAFLSKQPAKGSHTLMGILLT